MALFLIVRSARDRFFDEAIWSYIRFGPLLLTGSSIPSNSSPSSSVSSSEGFLRTIEDEEVSEASNSFISGTRIPNLPPKEFILPNSDFSCPNALIYICPYSVSLAITHIIQRLNKCRTAGCYSFHLLSRQLFCGLLRTAYMCAPDVLLNRFN
ncbi:hypothetical protein BpHYR1_043520 [Brachionus plicatilis]|uniref:Uncharacterized protein n=1 Tax=Brachionus plicatilis TaxID=10195 RepID=A0A3M7Q997_BRAPC|nr:hypothetical protein BpHYR1_043520 [Brachionus plicatilis]